MGMFSRCIAVQKYLLSHPHSPLSYPTRLQNVLPSVPKLSIVGVAQQDATAHLGTSDRVGQYHHPLGEPSCQLIWMCVESCCASSVPRVAGDLAS